MTLLRCPLRAAAAIPIGKPSLTGGAHSLLVLRSATDPESRKTVTGRRTQVPLYYTTRTPHTTLGHPCDIRGTRLLPARHPDAPLSLGAHELRLSATTKLIISAPILSLHLRPRDRLRGGIHPRHHQMAPISLSTKLPSLRLLHGPLRSIPLRFYNFRHSRARTASGPSPIDSACSKTPRIILSSRPRSSRLAQETRGRHSVASAAVEAIASTAPRPLPAAHPSSPLRASRA